jgi:hypothetical protein
MQLGSYDGRVVISLFLAGLSAISPSVHKRSWKNAKGEIQEARTVTLTRRASATLIKVEVRQGTHPADSESIRVAEAGRRWINTGEANAAGEPSTVISTILICTSVPFLGDAKISRRQ